MDDPLQRSSLIEVWLDLLIKTCNGIGDLGFALLRPCSPAIALVVLSAVLGFVMLLIWRYTSNQKAIADVRRQISAHLLATRLFRDNLAVTFLAQRQIIWQALRLLGYSIRPMMIMMVPFVLVMAQIGLRYEPRPLAVGERAGVCVTLRSAERMYGMGDRIALPDDLAADAHDPCRAEALRTVDWRITPKQAGVHRLVFGDGADRVEMPLVVGGDLDRISTVRGGGFWDRLLYSAEPAIPASSIFESIRIEYPSRSTPILGWDVHWLVSLLVLSIVFGLLFKPLLKVHI